MEHKKLSFALTDYKAEGKDEGVFEGYAAVFGNEDAVGDIIEPGAFANALKDTSRIRLLALHDDSLLPIGKPIELSEDDHGLKIKGYISPTSMGRDVRQLLRDKVLTEMSIGYVPVRDNFDSDGVRHLHEVELEEISLVTRAANELAQVTRYKSHKWGGHKMSYRKNDGELTAEDVVQIVQDEIKQTLDPLMTKMDELIKSVKNDAEPDEEKEDVEEIIEYVIVDDDEYKDDDPYDDEDKDDDPYDDEDKDEDPYDDEDKDDEEDEQRKGRRR